MADYYVHDKGYNVALGITKADYDGLNGRVNSLANKIERIGGGGYGSRFIYNSGNDTGTSFEKADGTTGITFKGAITGVVDDFYRSMTLKGTTSIDTYNGAAAGDIGYWGLNLSVLYNNLHLNMPIFTHVADQTGHVDWDSPLRQRPWKFVVPDRPTIKNPDANTQDHHWIGHINYLKPGIGEDTGALYYHRNLNGYMGAFHIKIDANQNVWLVPGAVRMLTAEECGWFGMSSGQAGLNGVAYKPQNIAHYLGDGTTDGDPTGITMDWEVTLNILHPGGD